MITVKNILVSTDFGKAADAALMYGRSLAGLFGARLHLVHVVQNVSLNTAAAAVYVNLDPQIQTDIEDALRKDLDALLIDSDQSGPPTTRLVIAANSTAGAIIDYAKENHIDLIVMGTHGRGLLAHLVMGSVAERVVRLAPCPVLTVKHPEHEFVRPDSLVAVAPSIERPTGSV